MVGGKKVGNSGEGMHRDQIGINRNERLRVESYIFIFKGNQQTNYNTFNNINLENFG